ncbi:MAG: DNA mismatch repair endonuclease MutL [Ruminococcaceae bacterium]|nr:DNA mismatch repair endonuclease MutL [Oscillospiraceae bacterium]
MAEIKLLPKSLAELIAAGEVVERPASVIKELVENSIDAGADKITVEIQRGGISYMRVTDNGCGIEYSQVPTAFMRHATSKIKSQDDLFKIATLGFRGEALASISAVARVEMLTKTQNSELGTRFVIEGGVQTEYGQTGCPGGTTIVIRDLFYNTPARMKFLKKDISEATAVASVVDAIALSHPEISIRFIKDSKPVLATNGDGKLKSAIYSVLGREYSSGLIPADSTTAGIRVSGMICKPVYCRPTRSGQFFFLNNRFVRSGTISKALDQAYKNTVMVGKFPAGVLNIEIPFDRVDVNVHPAKTEVRFSDEKAVFDAVYYAVKNALAQGDTRPELELKPRNSENTFVRMTTEEYRNSVQKSALAQEIYSLDKNRHFSKPGNTYTPKPNTNKFSSAADFAPALVSNETVFVNYNTSDNVPVTHKEVLTEKTESPIKNEAYQQIINAFSDDNNQRYENASFIDETEIEFKYIGEVFRTYLIVQFKGSVWFIDKHAAHERMLYNKLKTEGVTEVQTLLSPVAVTLSREEHSAVLENLELLNTAGFEVEEFGTVSVLVRSVPASLVKTDVMFLMCSIAANLVKFGKAETEILDDLYHNIACRSAIKGGNQQSAAEMEEFARQIISSNDIMYCPHGRPVAFELKRSELEKQFGRTK